MTRNLKALGLAFVAVFAMSAIAASAAHATEFFHSEKEKVIVTAENSGGEDAVGKEHKAPHIFELGKGSGLTTSCATAKFMGTENNATSKSATLTVTPEYTKCTFKGFEAIVDFKASECHYKLFAETTETTAGKPMGNVELLCTKAGGDVTITVPALGVVLHVAPQLVSHAISYTNIGAGATAEVTITATAGEEGAPPIKWSCTPKATCTAGIGAASGENAIYTGKATAQGWTDLTVGESKTGVYEEGVRQGISKGP